MFVRTSVALVVFCLRLFSAFADSCSESGSCQASVPTRRSGSAMLQTEYTSTPHHGPHQRKSTASASGDPSEVFLSLSNRVAAVDESVTQLETKSGEGREQLKAGLDALKAATSSFSSDLDGAKGRISAAEGALASLQGVVSENNKELRAASDALRSDFEALGNKVGQHWSSMLEAWSQRGDPSGSAALSAQVKSLDERCTKLEEEAGNGRTELKNELDAVEKQIADLQAGGAGSLEHSRSRAGSAEQEVAALAAAVDEQGNELSQGLADLKKRLQGLEKHLGGALAQKDTNRATGKVQALSFQDPASLPLTSRISSLEKRAAMLEEKSDDGRGELQIQLDTLTNQLAGIKEGGTESLAHTVYRITSLEGNVASLTAEVEQQKADVATETEALTAMLGGLNSKVGGGA